MIKHHASGRRYRRLFILMVLTAALNTTPRASGQTGTFNVATVGPHNWGTATNWSGSIFPGGAAGGSNSAIALLTNNITAAQTIELEDSVNAALNVALTQLNFGGTGAFTRAITTGAGGSLTFDGAAAALNVNSGTGGAVSISAPMTFASTISSAAGMTFSNSSARGLTLGGASGAITSNIGQWTFTSTGTGTTTFAAATAIDFSGHSAAATTMLFNTSSTGTQVVFNNGITIDLGGKDLNLTGITNNQRARFGDATGGVTFTNAANINVTASSLFFQNNSTVTPTTTTTVNIDSASRLILGAGVATALPVGITTLNLGGALWEGNSGTAVALSIADTTTLNLTQSRVYFLPENAVSVFTINTAIGETGGVRAFIHSGAGRTDLAAAGTYTGNTEILQGTMRADFAASGAPASNILPSGTTVIFGKTGTGPTVNNFTGAADAASAAGLVSSVLNIRTPGGATPIGQSFAGVTINALSNAILSLSPVIAPAAGGTLTVNLGTLARSVGGGTLTITQGATAYTLGVASGNATITATGTTASSLLTDSFGNAFVIINANGGYSWAAMNATNDAIVAATLINDNYTTATDNVSSTTNSSPAAFTINSLRVTNGGTARTLTLTSINTITSGGIVSTSGDTTAYLITGGTLRSGVSSGGDLIISQNAGNVAATLTINSVIADSPNGATGLIRTGQQTLAQVLILNGANTYTGPTRSIGGILRISNIADGGIASPLGQSTNAAGNLVLSSNTILDYLTLANVANPLQSTDRLFTLGTTSGATGVTIRNNSAIAASGTNVGGLQFSNTGFIAYDASANNTVVNLTLDGTNAGANSFATTLANPTGGILQLQKAGTGTWNLTGTSSYGGTLPTNTASVAVTIAAGTLGVEILSPIGTNSSVGNSGETIFVAINSVLNYTGATTSFDRRLAGTGAADGANPITIAVSNSAANLTYTGLGWSNTAVINGVTSASDSIIKMGAGTFTLAPTSDSDGSIFYVLEGQLNIAGTGQVNNVLSIRPGATVRLTGTSGDLLENNNELRITGGTFALDGGNETLGALNGFGTITNLGTAARTLTAFNNNTNGRFFGSITDGTAALSFSKGSGGVGFLLTGIFTDGSNTHSYTGNFAMGGGAVVINQLTNAGTASGIGAGGAAATTWTINSTFRYLGETTSSNRAFTLAAGSFFEVTKPNTTVMLNPTGAGSVTANALTIQGGGNLILRPGAASSINGITFGGGTTTFDFSGFAGAATNLIAFTADPVFRGGKLILIGQPSAATLQTVDDITFDRGAATISLNLNTATSLTFTSDLWLRVTSATHARYSTLHVDKSLDGTLNANNSNLTSVGANGILPWAIVTDTAFNGTTNAASFLTIAAGTGAQPVSGLAGTLYTTLTGDQNSAATQFALTNSVTLTAANPSYHALRIDTTSAGHSLNLNGQNVTFGANSGILFVGAHNYSITGGTAQIQASTTNDLIIHQYGTGTLTLDATVGSSATATGALVKTGTGTLVLSNMSGGSFNQLYTVINEGVLEISDDLQLGSSRTPAAGLTATIGDNTTSITSINGTGTSTIYLGAIMIASTGGSSTSQVQNPTAVADILSPTAMTSSRTHVNGAATTTGATLNFVSNVGAAVLLNGGTLRFTADVDLSRVLMIQSAGGVIDTGAHTVRSRTDIALYGNATNNHPGTLVKTGSGTLEIRGRQDGYNGTILISQGTVLMSGATTGVLNYNTESQIILNDSNTGSTNTALLWNFTGVTADAIITKLIIVDNFGTGTVTIGSTAGTQNLLFDGGLIVNRDTILQTGHTGEAVIFRAGIMGLGNLTVQSSGGGGTFRMTFQPIDNPSSYSNALSVNSNATTARLSRYEYGNLTLVDPGVGSSLFLRFNDTGLIAATSSVTLGNRTTWELGADNTINALNGVAGSSVTVAGGDDQFVVLTLGANGASGDHQGTIINARTFGIVKTGAGTQTFGGANTYNGGTEINMGRLNVNNTTASATGTGYVRVNSGGTLGGTGIIAPTTRATVNSLSGTVSTDAGVYINSGGTLAPGISLGKLTIATAGIAPISFQNGSNFNVDLTSPTTPGTTYDQLDLTGVVGTPLLNLGNATLNVTFDVGYVPLNGDKFYIITQSGTASVNGTFNGLNQDAQVVTNFNGSGLNVYISYTGDFSLGTIIGGNDVVLYLAVPEPRNILFIGLILLTLAHYARRRFPRLVYRTGLNLN